MKAIEAAPSPVSSSIPDEERDERRAAVARGRVAIELTVGLPDQVPLIDGGRDLDNYLW
jgi:hypothetical protein